jgi:hypothetical protein
MKYYGIQINMNEVTKLKYCGFAEGIKDVDTLDEAEDYAMEEYFDEQGFGGEIFVCENEFYDCEYQDVGYMEYLLPKDMLMQYNSYQ